MSEMVEQLLKGVLVRAGNNGPIAEDVDAADILMRNASFEISSLKTRITTLEADNALLVEERDRLRESTPAPEAHVVGAVWNEIGTALALLSEEDASPKARALIRQALESATGCKAPQYLGGAPTPADWSDMAKAPKDGTMLRLLVNPDKEEFTAFDDSLTPFETIGFNNLADTGEDRWEFAGWDWQQDCFITGRGEVIGWMPFKAAIPSHLEAAIRWCLDRDERNGSLPEVYAEKLRTALTCTPAPSPTEAAR